MGTDQMKSIQLHLDYSPGEVVEVDELIDVGAGMYPVYYTQLEDKVLASTSVTELIFELGSFERNIKFTPPNFFDAESTLEKIARELPDELTSQIPTSIYYFLDDIGLIDTSSNWTGSIETADERISVLRPFERVTPNGSEKRFNPTFSINDPNEFVERSAEEIKKFIHKIERSYPDHEHIIRVGGRDSQLIALAPKLTDNWHVFSSEPNYWIVDKFLFKNDIEIGEFFHHDNKNEESWRDFRRKLICGDIRANPRHQRWYPTLDDITDRFEKDCIFWIGTEGDTINTYFRPFHEAEDYFEGHFKRAANWQALTHQVTKNYTSAPALSPYHSESIWENLYRHYDPEMLSKGADLRPAIANQWHDQDIWWPERNPHPDPYNYPIKSDYRREYFDYISNNLEGSEESVINRWDS